MTNENVGIVNHIYYGWSHGVHDTKMFCPRYATMKTKIEYSSLHVCDNSPINKLRLHCAHASISYYHNISFQRKVFQLSAHAQS